MAGTTVSFSASKNSLLHSSTQDEQEQRDLLLQAAECRDIEDVNSCSKKGAASTRDVLLMEKIVWASHGGRVGVVNC